MSAFAQAAGLAALQSDGHMSYTLVKLRNDKEDFVTRLKELNYKSVPSHTNYFLLAVGNGAQFRDALLQKGILVRDCASFGLPSSVRLATLKPEQNIRFIETLSQSERVG